jgi:hypothetical protein
VSYIKKRSLDSHMDSVHNGIRYKCTGCDKLIKRKNDSYSHLKKCRVLNIYAQMERFESDVFIETPDIMKISHTEKMVNFPDKESTSPAPKKSRIEEFPSKNSIFSLNGNSCKEETFFIQANISQTETCPYKEIIDSVPKISRNEESPAENPIANLSANSFKKETFFIQESIAQTQTSPYEDIFDPAPENTQIEEFPSKKATVNLRVKEVLEEKKRYQCQFCPLFYGKQNSLNFHINSVHNGIRFNCQFCPEFYTKKIWLNSHIDSVHNGVRYKCTGCGKLRHRKGDCVKHIKKCKLVNFNAKMEKIKLDVFTETTATKIEIVDP